MEYLDLQKSEWDRYRFYHTSAWRKLREFFLNQNPLCKECLKNNIITPATDVDHIVPLQEAPELALDIINLQSFCRQHHTAKTISENNFFGKSSKSHIKNRKWKFPGE